MHCDFPGSSIAVWWRPHGSNLFCTGDSEDPWGWFFICCAQVGAQVCSSTSADWWQVRAEQLESLVLNCNIHGLIVLHSLLLRSGVKCFLQRWVATSSPQADWVLVHDSLPFGRLISSCWRMPSLIWLQMDTYKKYFADDGHSHNCSYSKVVGARGVHSMYKVKPRHLYWKQMVDVLASFCPVHLGAEKDVRFSFCAGQDLCSSPYFLILWVRSKGVYVNTNITLELLVWKWHKNPSERRISNGIMSWPWMLPLPFAQCLKGLATC